MKPVRYRFVLCEQLWSIPRRYPRFNFTGTSYQWTYQTWKNNNLVFLTFGRMATQVFGEKMSILYIVTFYCFFFYRDAFGRFQFPKTVDKQEQWKETIYGDPFGVSYYQMDMTAGGNFIQFSENHKSCTSYNQKKIKGP